MTIKRLSKVSLIELYPGLGIQYIRSSGCFGKLIKFDFEKHVALIELPSGVSKNFSIYSLSSIGGVSLPEKKHVKNTKAGFYKNLGKKSKVRGVAMNPIDHPHGGRTKSIKYPRTP
jgi:large subunit ribosomal protein L2